MFNLKRIFEGWGCPYPSLSVDEPTGLLQGLDLPFAHLCLRCLKEGAAAPVKWDTRKRESERRSVFLCVRIVLIISIESDLNDLYRIDGLGRS